MVVREMEFDDDPNWVEDITTFIHPPVDLSQLSNTQEEGFQPRDVSEAIHARIIKEKELDERVLDESRLLTDRMMIHLNKRVLFAEVLCPLIISSIGGHIGDIHQADPSDIPGGHDLPFYYCKGMQDVVAAPVNIVSPAGFSKSYLIKNFFKAEVGICPLKSKVSAKITEAGFVGTAGREGEPVMGDAFLFRNGYLLFNEMSNLFITSESSHSAELVNQVMEALSERFVQKRLGNLDIAYPTCVSIIGGIQPYRFNTAQGVGRRFMHDTKIWSIADIELFKLERMKEKVQKKEHKKVNQQEVNHIRDEITKVLHGIIVEDVEWDAKMYEYMFQKSKSHLDQEMMERVILGHELLDHGRHEKTLVIKRTERNIGLIDMFTEMHQIVSMGGDVSYLSEVLSKGDASQKALWHQFQVFGYTYTHFRDVLKTCVSLGLIQSRFDPATGGSIYGKPQQPVSILEKLEHGNIKRLG